MRQKSSWVRRSAQEGVMQSEKPRATFLRMNKLAVIQLNSSDVVANNLEASYGYLQVAKKQGAVMAVLPENFAWMGHEAESVASAEPYGQGVIQDFLAKTSRTLGLWIVAGSLKLTLPGTHKVSNSQLIYTNEGECIARYDKIHLFDAVVTSDEAYQESDNTQSGNELIVVDAPCGKLGASICYDLRFPELYQALRQRGAELIVVPAAFTHTTGKAHWEALLRARAIENQVYIAAATQTGIHANQRETYGHALIIDPWGRIMANAGEAPGIIMANIDLKLLTELRLNMPVAHHKRTDIFA